MPIYEVGDVIETQLLMLLEGQSVMVTPFFQVVTKPTLPTQLRDEMRNQFWQTLKLCISNRVTCVGWRSRRVHPAPKSDFISEAWASDNGSVISNLGHQGVSSIIVVDHEGGLALKTGRMYPPGSGLGYVNGSYDTNGQARLDNVCNGLRARFALGGSLPWLMHVKRTYNPASNGYLYFRVTGYRWRHYLGMQRRRRPGVGA